jgi:hypothetical protein
MKDNSYMQLDNEEIEFLVLRLREKCQHTNIDAQNAETLNSTYIK